MKLNLPNLCVFHRELSGLARQRKLLFARLLMLVPGAWVLLMLYMDRSGDLAVQGSQGFIMLILLELAAIAIVIPVLTATIIAEELEQNTLQLLLLTRQAPGRVLLQKLMSRIVGTLVLLLLPLPLLITLTSTGGVSDEMLIFGLLTLLLAFEVCLLGSLMASWFTRTVIAAYLMSYIAIAAMWSILVVSMMQMVYWGPWSETQWRLVLIATVIGVVALPIACLITFWRIKTVAMRPARTPLWVSLYNRFNRAVRRLHKWGRPLVKDGSLDTQPMLWREYHQRFYATNSFILRFLALVAIFVAVIFVITFYTGTFSDSHNYSYYGSNYWIQVLWGYVVNLTLACFSALVPLLLGISVITREEGRQSLDSLRVTPLSDNAIFGAKLWLVLKVSFLCQAIVIAVLLRPIYRLQQLFGVATGITYYYYGRYSRYNSYNILYDLEPIDILNIALLLPTLVLLIACTSMLAAMQRRRFLPALLQVVVTLALIIGLCFSQWSYLTWTFGLAGYHAYNWIFATLGAFAVWQLARMLVAIRGIAIVKLLLCVSAGVGLCLFLYLTTSPPWYFHEPRFELALAAWSLAHLMLWLAWRQTSRWRRPD